MDCPTCGDVVGEGDVFCKHCGTRLQVAESASRSGAVDDLAAEYRNLLAEKPDDPDALYNVGLAELYSGNPKVAEEYFSRVAALLPNDFAAHEKLAICLAKLGRREEAAESARTAYRLDPERESIQRILRVLEG